MGLSVLNQPAASSGGIKSVQRGSAAGAGNVTITAVDITKSFVNVFGTTSSGTVAASGTINATSGNINASNGNIASTTFTSGSQTANGQYINGFNTGSPWYTLLQSNAGGNANNLSFTYYNPATTYTGNSTSFSANSTSLTGGSNNLVAAVVQGYLSNSTTLVVSGACRWEVVEFN